MLGLDPLALANEGSMLLAAPPDRRADIAAHLAAQPDTAEARLAGRIDPQPAATVLLETEDGATKLLPLPDRLGVPRLC